MPGMICTFIKQWSVVLCAIKGKKDQRLLKKVSMIAGAKTDTVLDIW